MRTPRRILIATADYPPIEGGISTVTRETARALVEQGHTVTVLAPAVRVDRPVMGDDTGATVIAYPGYHLGPLRVVPMLIKGLPLARRHDRLLGMNITHGGVLGLLAQLLFGTPYTVFAYAYEFLKYERAPLRGALIRLLYRRAERILAISRFSRDALVRFGVPEGRITLALPGARAAVPVAEETIRAVRHRLAIDEGPIVLSVGRLVPRKRHATLVHAFSRALRRVPDAWLVIAGQGPEMPVISRFAYRLGIRDRVVLPGVVTEADLTALYAACTVFALPCGEDAAGQVEGFGLVFTEAHAHGRPVIGGRSGGVGDAVLDGETGLLVEPDDLDGLTSALTQTLTDPALAARLGEAGRRRIEGELSWHAFAASASGILPDAPE